MSFQEEKIIQTKTCKHCNASFDITDKDLEFYEKVSPSFGGVKYNIPTPILCPDCRQQRRLAFRNERKLYKRKCDFTGKDIISIYSPDKPYKVYGQEIWWSDKWDAMDYGREFDFNKSFFEQFNELLKEVPRSNLPKCGVGTNVNSEYTVGSEECKNCYMLSNSINVNSGMYSITITESNNIFDSINIKNSESIYQCINCHNSYNLFYSQNCNGCKDSYFLENCIGCSNCIGCVNLNNKEYYILNKKYSKENYKNELINIFQNKEEFKEKYIKLKNNLPYKNIDLINSDNCLGNGISYSKNCYYCFDINGNENTKYCFVSQKTNNSYDISFGGYVGDLVYEIANSGINVYNSAFIVYSYNYNNLYYCSDCNNCSNCFGCIGLKNKSYCILNKQYTKEQYEELVPKIIEHMKKTGEWGEFFPASISPFGYNETVAMEYFPISPLLTPPYEGGEENSSIPPLTRGRGGRGFNRSDYEAPFPKVEKIIPSNKLPDDIKDIPDDILNWAIECEVTKKPFRIIKQELDFYRKHNLPIPKRHPDQRHLDRMSLRNPRKLYDRTCDKCGKDIKTTYSPERPEIVYCEECYNKEVY